MSYFLKSNQRGLDVFLTRFRWWLVNLVAVVISGSTNHTWLFLPWGILADLESYKVEGQGLQMPFKACEILDADYSVNSNSDHEEVSTIPHQLCLILPWQFSAPRWHSGLTERLRAPWGKLLYHLAIIENISSPVFPLPQRPKQFHSQLSNTKLSQWTAKQTS